MRKKFKSLGSAYRFAKGFGVMIKKGKACKMADGSKGYWFTITKKKGKKKK
jgi:hypothetical protein